MNVELRHLRAFVTLAEELNFTRAAERLHIAQQALSKQIRQLEERVGTELVTRTTRKVELTPAGSALLEQARPLLSAAEDAVAAARRVAGGGESLTVGFVAAVTYDDAGAALERFAERRPDVEVLIKFGDLLDPSGGLRAHEADVAFTHGPFAHDDLELEALWQEPMGVLVAEGHPLAKGELTLERVVDEPTFDFPTADREWRDFWMLTAHRGGRPPKVVAAYHSLDALTAAVRSGLGLHLSAESIESLLPPGSGVVHRTMPELPPLVHHVAWRKGDQRRLVADFVTAAREAFPTALQS